MSKDILKDVISFNQKVIGLKPIKKTEKPIAERLNWFYNVLTEEYNEMNSAVYASDPAGVLDALVDMIYFVLGRVHEYGFTPEEFYFHWNNVHKANMKKKKGNKGRGSNEDAIKPLGWISPEDKYRKKFLKGK